MTRNALRSFALYAALVASGAGGLTWEVLWQHRTALALGISAFGTAVTLASMMAGLGLGALLVERCRWSRAGLRGYGVAELCVASGGLLVAPGLEYLAAIDTLVYAHSSVLADVVQIAGTALLLAVPAAAMGATFPLLTPVANAMGVRLSALYAANTFGAVLGVLAATFLAIPRAGVRGTELLAATLDVSVGLWALARGSVPQVNAPRPNASSPHEAALAATSTRALVLAAVSGVTIFVLEVSWFRSIRAALQATTETFAVVVAAFLLALTLGSALVRALASRARSVSSLTLPLAGYAVLRATSAIDALDTQTMADDAVPLTLLARLLQLLQLLVIPVTLLGTVLPATLEAHRTSSGVARLYAINTLAAVLGSLGAGFVLLPSIGSTHTSWFAGALLLGVALTLAILQRSTPAIVTTLVLCVAAAFEVHSGGDGARQRVQGHRFRDFGPVLFLAEGPDSTVWVTTVRPTNKRALVIDGFETSGEGPDEHYMRFMGTLPALATPQLARALVICFGTGQTANAVRRQGPEQLDIAEVNADVLRAAKLFPTNESVLRDPRVHASVMDGRAFLRRSPPATYDVITLEPMPPNFAGVNNLYSREFYHLLATHLSTTGIAAQWLPLHLIAASHMRSIIATFSEAFPHSRLWVDPVGGTGVLVGGRTPWMLHASKVPLDLSLSQIQAAFMLDARALQRVARGAPIITDDNQLLAYGLARFGRVSGSRNASAALYDSNLAELRRAQRQ